MNLDFRSLILAQPTVTSQLSEIDAVNFSIRPDKSSLPSITLTQASDTPDYLQEGRNGTRQTRIQCDVWSETYLKAFQIEQALTAALEASIKTTVGDTYFVRIFNDSTRDLGFTDLDGGEKVFHRSTDFIIMHRSGV